jgi:hypothetical protein
MHRGKANARSPRLGCHTDPNGRNDRPALSRPRHSLPAPRRSGASSPDCACSTSLRRERGGICAERRAASMNSRRLRRGFRLRCPGVEALSPRPARLQFASAESVFGGGETSSSSSVAIGGALTMGAIASAGYFLPLCRLGIGDHLWVSRADFALADFSIGTKDDPPPHLIKFCTRHDFCFLRIAPAAFLSSPLVKHSAPPMLLPLSIWERA